MDLNLSKDLFNREAIRKIVNEFVDELNKILFKDVGKTQISLDESKKDTKLITQFRDKMYIEQNNILNKYAKETAEMGKMYYIYSFNSKSDNVVNVCICKEEKNNTVLEVPIEELPSNAKKGSVLRKKDNQYVIDEEATKKILEYIQELENKILEEQNEFLNSVKIDGHVYEVSDIGEDRIFLFDATENAQYTDEIEDINVPIELLKNVKIGDLLKYQNKCYEIELQNVQNLRKIALLKKY